VFEFFSLSFFFQHNYDGETSELDHNSPPTNMLDSRVPSDPRSPCRCAEHLSRIADLEGRLSLLKRQANTAVDQAGKYFGLMKWVSSLESRVSDLMAKIVHLEECDSFLVEIIESACEQLQCEFLEPHCAFCCVFYGFICFNFFFSSGTCLNPVDENHQVFERIAALERASSDTNTFWVDSWCHSAIVLLQDCAQDIGESVDGCQKSLTTIYSVMLPRNPPPENFGKLLEVLRTSRRIHRLIELNLVAGTNFFLG
jgi:hypothetical protein